MNSVVLVLLVITLALGYIAATYWSGRRLSLPDATNLRQAGFLTSAIISILALATIVARKGLLSRFDVMPPYVLRYIMPHFMLTIFVARSAFGRRLATGLPLPVLIGFQVFRIPVELLLHSLYVQGLIPVQMTFAGRNLDIITGFSAIPVAFLAARQWVPRWMLLTWNLMGPGFLVNIVGIAITSMPGPLRLFSSGPPNALIAQWPYIWLPTFLVTTALLGHLLVFRRLWQPESTSDLRRLSSRRKEMPL